MTCKDLIGQYEEGLIESFSSGAGTIGTFSLTQHWPNGQAGHASGWLHIVPNVPQDPLDVPLHIGKMNLSYDPYGRNPAFIYVGRSGAIGILYQGGPSMPTLAMSTDLTNLDCNSSSSPLVVMGTESKHSGPANPALPAYDVLTLGTFSLWEIELLKELVPTLAGVTA